MLLRAGIVILLFASNSVSWAEDFNQFRGPAGRGAVAEANIPNTWSGESGLNIAWSTEIDGSGWSQPLVIGDRLFLTAAQSAKDLRPKNFSDGVKTPQSMGMGFMARAPKVDIEWKVICLDRGDGRLLWERAVHKGRPKYAIHPSNTYATETPVADRNGIYVYFGATGNVAGFSLDGQPRWTADVGVFKTSNNFGTGSSMAIHDGKVFVQNLSQGSAAVTCFDTLTGEKIWQRERDKNETSWSSPILWNNAYRSELIVSGGERVDSYDPATGATLWSVDRVKAATACSVCADNKQLYFGGSDPFSKGSLFAVSAGGQGDLSPKKSNTKFTNCTWMVKRAAPGMASPVSSGQFIYIADKNILRCYDASTGERLYQNRVPDLAMVNASPLIIGDQVLLLDEQGGAALIRVGKEFQVVGGGKIADTFWATPAVDGNSVYFRGVKRLYCVRSTSDAS